MSVRFNLLSPEVKANPYPTYARMRREAPVCQVDPGGMWAVSRHDDVLRVLKDPQRFSSQGFRVATNAFIDEVLRYEPPAQAAPRLTTEEVELGGVRLPKGAPVLVLLGSAAHDEAHFPDGDRFNLSRPGPQNLPFGHGIHFCLGAQLARMEGRLALEALLDAFRHVEAGPEPMTWHRTLVVRGPATLPLVLHPA